MGVAREIFDRFMAIGKEELAVNIPGGSRLLIITPCYIPWSDLIDTETGPFEGYALEERISKSKMDPTGAFFFLVTSSRSVAWGSIQPHLACTDAQTSDFLRDLQERFGYYFGGIAREFPAPLIQAINLQLEKSATVTVK